MKNLQEATERICELKGSLVALDALVTALLHAMPAAARNELLHTFEGHAEVARTVLLNAATSEHTLAAFERDIRRTSSLIGAAWLARSVGQSEEEVEAAAAVVGATVGQVRGTDR